MDKYFNFSKNEYVINNLESDSLVERNEANQDITGDLTVNGNLTITDTLTANEMVTNGDISTEDGLIEHLKVEGQEPVNDKNFGDYAEYRENSTDKFKGYAVGAGEDKMYIFANSTSRPLQDTDLSTLDKGTVSVREPVTDDEPATKGYTDIRLNALNVSKLDKSGGTMTGDLMINKLSELNLGGDMGNGGNRLFTIGTNDLVIAKGTKYMTFGENSFDTSLPINMTDNKITNVTDGTDAGDAVNKSQLDTKLNLSGGTMTSNINMDTNDILNANTISLKPTTPGGNTFLDFISGDGNRGKLFVNGMCRMEISTANPDFTRFQLFEKLQMDDKIYFSSPHKIEGLQAGTAPNDAVNVSQLSGHVQEHLKMAYFLSGTSSTANIGDYTFTFDNALSDSVNMLLTINFNMEFSGTVVNSEDVTFDITMRDASNSITFVTSKTGHPLTQDIGSSTNYVTNTFKFILGSPSTTKTVQVQMKDYATSATKTYYHTLELERIQ